MEKLYSIYTLMDENKNIFYVGQTANPTRRLARHITDAKYSIKRYPVNNKLRCILNLGLDKHKIFEVIENNISESDIDQREIYYINLFRERGFDIKNLTSGGRRGFDFTSSSTIHKIRKAHIGVKRSQLTCIRISDALTGIPFTSTHKLALKKAWETRDPLSPEHYKKISAINRGVINIKKYVVMSPDGVLFVTEKGLQDFCREHQLSCGNLINTKPNGTRKHHKGWKIIREVEKIT